MKKTVFISFTLLITVLSCRQEDSLSNEDIRNLKIIQDTRNLRKNNIKPKDSVVISTNRLVEGLVDADGQILPPPKQ